MIKNIVFDMGNVLLEYDAMKVCRRFIANPREQQMVFTALFVSPEWILMDMGVLPEALALAQIKRRLPDHLHQAADLCFNHWHEYAMTPYPRMKEIIAGLKGRGYNIYLCSNASLRMLDCYKQLIPGVEYFDGILFSAAEKLLKPQHQIYERLFERFSLNPRECFFIDDVQLNLDGAEECGMRGYCFNHKDFGRLEQELEKLQELP